MEDLKAIIKTIQAWTEELTLKASDDMILDCATRIYNSKNIEVEKKKTPATEKQIYALKKLGVEKPETYTKQEASKKIEELKK